MKRTFLIVVLLLALVLVPTLGTTAQDCEDEIGCVVLGPDDPVTIASILGLSGPVSFLGEDSYGGIQLALSARDNMVLDREIEWISEDDQCVAEGGQVAAQRVAANPDVVGIIGTACSGAAAAAMPILGDAGLLMISPANTSPFLTSTDEEAGGIYIPGYFRTAHNDLFQGAVAAQYAYNVLGLRKAATIHDGDPYTDGLQGAMADAFRELGGEVVFQGAVNKGDTNMSPILTEVAASGADVLYYPIFEPESNFITQQVQDIEGLEDITLMSADGSFVDSFPENTGEAAIGMYMSGPQVSGEAYEEFLALWEEEIGGVPPSGFHAHAWDATNILLNSIESVAVELDDGSVSIGRQALRDAVADTEEFEGLTGVLTCQEESPFMGDCATGKALAMFQITEAEVNGSWPPPPIWTPADAEEDE